MFEGQAAAHPDRTAVVSSEGSFTYRELNERANRVAQLLLFFGIAPDDLVCILLPRSIEAYVAMPGVLKAGVAYTVVNVNYPDDRIDYIYRDGGCRYLI